MANDDLYGVGRIWGKVQIDGADLTDGTFLIESLSHNRVDFQRKQSADSAPLETESGHFALRIDGDSVKIAFTSVEVLHAKHIGKNLISTIGIVSLLPEGVIEPPTIPLDEAYKQMAALYAMWKLIPEYTGDLNRLRWASTNEELAIAPDASGRLDFGAIWDFHYTVDKVELEYLGTGDNQQQVGRGIFIIDSNSRDHLIAVFRLDMPSVTPADGLIFEKGGTGTGASFYIENGDFVFRAGDGSQTLASANPDTTFFTHSTTPYLGEILDIQLYINRSTGVLEMYLRQEGRPSYFLAETTPILGNPTFMYGVDGGGFFITGSTVPVGTPTTPSDIPNIGNLQFNAYSLATAVPAISLITSDTVTGVTKFDQQGNGDLIQASPTAQPELISNGVFNLSETGHPIFSFDGSNDNLSVSIPSGFINNDVSIFSVINLIDDGTEQRIISLSRFGQFFFLQRILSNDTFEWFSNATIVQQASFGYGLKQITAISSDGVAGGHEAFIDGVSVGTATSNFGAGVPENILAIGSNRSNNGNFSNGGIGEILIADIILDNADRTLIQDDENKRWEATIESMDFDFIYATKRLVDSLVDYMLIVRRSADNEEKSFLFLKDGDFPKQEILNHTGGTNHLVHSNDFTQTEWQKIQSGTGTIPIITPNQVGPFVGVDASRVECSIGTGAAFSLVQQNAFDLVPDFTGSLFMKSNNGSDQTVSFRLGLAANTTFLVTPEWQRFDFTSSDVSVADFFSFGLRDIWGSAPSTALDILVAAPHLNDGTGVDDFAITDETGGLQDGVVAFQVEQMGSGNDIFETIPSNQPKIISAGILNVNEFGEPELRFDGTNDSLSVTLSSNITGQDLECFGVISNVVKDFNSDGILTIYDSAQANDFSNNASIIPFLSEATFKLRAFSIVEIVRSTNDVFNTGLSHQINFNMTASAPTMTVDGVAGTFVANKPGSLNANSIVVGARFESFVFSKHGEFGLSVIMIKNDVLTAENRAIVDEKLTELFLT